MTNEEKKQHIKNTVKIAIDNLRECEGFLLVSVGKQQKGDKGNAIVACITSGYQDEMIAEGVMQFIESRDEIVNCVDGKTLH